MDIGIQNETWASKIIDGFIGQGIDYFCCAPGSRSTALILAIAEHPKASRTVHFDERGACFHAVGYAKAKRKPAIVVTTSGTAVGNLLPGVIEAYNARVPLILLTADRPPELRDCGANQSCDQTKLFSNHIRWQCDLPCPDRQISDRFLASTISHAVAVAQSPLSGPIHINCMFREPLLSALGEHVNKAEKHIHFEHACLHPSKASINHWIEILSVHKQGILLAGSGSDEEEILSLAEKLKWPLFADIFSSLRKFKNHPCLITHFDPILKLKGQLTAHAFIQFGDRFVSKTLSQWLEKQRPAFYLHVSSHSERQDPAHLVTHRIQASPALFTRELLDLLNSQKEDTWRSQWKEWDETCKHSLTDFFSHNLALTEPGLIWQLTPLLSEDWALFLGNSMPVRDADQFFSPLSHCGPLFGNRGVSGIDGNIATAAGIAQGSGKPTLALIGDLAFLHDLNSLAYLSKITPPVLICVVNNGGGGIFSFLPVAKREEAFEECIAASHKISFASAASLFSLPYFHPQTPLELKNLLSLQKSRPTSCVIEITTNRAENVRIHEQIINTLRTCLNSAHSSAEIPAILH
jgi:2-succinyl-5-enolpyruvyl-6-hydroxy-3-cyclohexene-1-carboxylate synthase